MGVKTVTALSEVRDGSRCGSRRVSSRKGGEPGGGGLGGVGAWLLLEGKLEH